MDIDERLMRMQRGQATLLPDRTLGNPAETPPPPPPAASAGFLGVPAWAWVGLVVVGVVLVKGRGR